MESAELIAILREVRDRVRARNPETAAGGPDIPLPDLMPLVHARDAALGKVAAIGTVNPRPGGLVNSLVRAWKRWSRACWTGTCASRWSSTARSMACIDAALEALNDTNRALVRAGRPDRDAGESREELKDIRNHWADWRAEWERKLQQNEIQFLRSVADLQGALSASRHLDGLQLSRADARCSTRRSPARWTEDAGHPEAPVGGPGADPAGIRAADPLRAADHPAAGA